MSTSGCRRGRVASRRYERLQRPRKGRCIWSGVLGTEGSGLVLRGAVVLVLALSPALLACSDDSEAGPGVAESDDRSSSTTTTVSDPTTTTTNNGQRTRAERREAAVLAAYNGYWRSILAANDPPNQDYPGLRRFATGDAYRSVFDAAQANRLTGRALRLPANSQYSHDVRLESADADAASVRDCAVDDGLVVDLRTGEVLNDTISTTLIRADLLRQDGRWLVATTAVEQRWEGVAGCAA